MIVDDEEGVRILISKIVECHLHMNTCCFESPLEAIEFFKENFEQITLVISDFEMPLMNGQDLIKALKDIHHNVKMGVVSGCFDDKGIFAKKQCPNADFSIAKPFEAKTIIDEINKQLVVK